jgi:hypothetical protein
MAPDDRSDHFVPLLAYSTGLLAGLLFVDIVAHLIGAHPREGNRMSTAKTEAPELPGKHSETEAEYTLRIRNAIRRGIDAAAQGRVVTHEDAMRRLAPWLED